jgi:hypothetical protein
VRTTAPTAVTVASPTSSTAAPVRPCKCPRGDRQRGYARGEKHLGQHEKSPFERKETVRSLHRSNR